MKVESILPNDLREFMIYHGYGLKTTQYNDGSIEISFSQLPLNKVLKNRQALLKGNIS